MHDRHLGHPSGTSLPDNLEPVTPEMEELIMQELDSCRLIPSELLVKLGQLEPILLENGAVVPRHRNGSFYLRYRDHGADQGAVHRSIEIPDPLVADAVGALIVIWREQQELIERARREKAEQRRATSYEGTKKKLIRTLVDRFGGSSKRRRRRIARELAAIADNPAALHAYTVTAAFLAPPSRPGRPPKSALS